MEDRTHHGGLREACITEAAAIIGEKGLDALSMREVARRLGVSHQAPYKHFENRDQILAELIIRALAGFADALRSRPEETDPYLDLEAIGCAYLDYAMNHPLNYQLMFGSPLIDPTAYPALAEAGRGAFEILLAAIRALPGRAHADARSVELDAMFAWSTVHGVASLLHSHAVQVQTLMPDTIAGLRTVALKRITDALSTARTGRQ